MSDRTFRFWLLCAVPLLLIYFWNVGGNSIWMPDESLYAESVREMLESGSYLDPYYNYEPRLQKPPLTYWIAAGSAALFGLNEFSLRLPVVLCALATVVMTYLLGAVIHDRRTGLWAALVMSLSLQFMINSRYLSPEVPLTCMFTLTMLLFTWGLRRDSFHCSILSYAALALVVLTKGFPFMIVLGAIMGSILLVQAKGELKPVLHLMRRTAVVPGFIAALAVSGAWYLYSYQKFGDVFYNAQFRETVSGALHDKAWSFGDLTFYPLAMLWGFAPYSLVLCFGLIRILQSRELLKRFSVELCWIAAVLVIFTIVREKNPAYIIPAHPAFSLIAAWHIAHYRPRDSWTETLLNLCYGIPSACIAVGLVALAVLVGLPYAGYLIPTLLLSAVLCYWKHPALPFASAAAAFLTFGIWVLPVMEKSRHYQSIGRAVVDADPSAALPFHVEGQTIENLPYYAKRKVVFDQSSYSITSAAERGPLLALVETAHLDVFTDCSTLWEGRIYTGGSESKTARFLGHIIKEHRAETDKFTDFTLAACPASQPLSDNIE